MVKMLKFMIKASKRLCKALFNALFLIQLHSEVEDPVPARNLMFTLVIDNCFRKCLNNILF